MAADLRGFNGLEEKKLITEGSEPTGALFDWSASILLAGPGFPLTAVDIFELNGVLTVRIKPRENKLKTESDPRLTKYNIFFWSMVSPL